MIKLEEVRCGNLFHYRPSENSLLQSKMDWQDIKWLSEDPKGFNSVHNKIYLDDEWLIKLGFIKKAGREGFNYVKDKVEIGLSSQFFLQFGNDNRSSVHIAFVHQLQNLHYALTGNELILE